MIRRAPSTASARGFLGFRPSGSGLVLAAILVAWGTAACAWAPGGAFTTVAPASLGLRWATVADRIDEVGRWRTADGWLLNFTQGPELLDARVSLEGQGQASATTSAPAAPFDPAKPPPGFSLCHNGHCHATSGALVPYAEVAAVAAGGSAAPQALTLLRFQNPTSPVLLGAPAWALLAEGQGPYPQEGSLSGAALVGTLALQGTALPGPGADGVAGLPVPFRLRWPLRLRQAIPEASLQAWGAQGAGGQLGKAQALRRLAFEMSLVLPQGLLDGQDWATRQGLQDPAASSPAATWVLNEDSVAAEKLVTASAALSLQMRWWLPEGP